MMVGVLASVRPLRLCIAVFCLALSGCAKSRDADVLSLETAVREFADAYRTGDVETVDALLANDYVHTNSGGAPGDRDSYLAWNRTRAENLQSRTWSVEAYELSELQMKPYDGFAIVTGRITASGVRDGAPWMSDIRFTNVWIVEDETWKRTAFHDAAVPE